MSRMLAVLLPAGPVSRRTALLLAAVISGAIFQIAPGFGHEYWLMPSAYRAAAGNLVTLSAWTGTGFRGERKLYSSSRTVLFRATASVEIDLARAAGNGDDTFARFAASDDSGTVISYQSNYTSIELEPERFDHYLKEEGLDGPLAERRKNPKPPPGRERYRRCAKTWISGTVSGAVVDPSGDVTARDRVTRPQGLPLEIIPLADPAANERFRIRLLFDGRPLPGALVKAWNRPLARDAVPEGPAARDSVHWAWQGRTDANGLAELSLPGPGEWLIGAVHMVRSAEPSADWESTWASLTFARLQPARH